MDMKDFKINFIHLCDDVIFSQDGKISLIGVFDVVNLVALPGSLAKAVLVLNINVLNKDINKLDLDIIVKENKTGNEILKTPTMTTSFSVNTNDIRLGMTLQLVNMAFKSTGKYSIEILLNKKLVESLTFDVKLLEQKKGEKN